jgi:hypothetical protein
MKSLKTPIIPGKATFIGEKKALDYEAICVFVATGFFLDDDTYFKKLKVQTVQKNILEHLELMKFTIFI